MSAQRIHPAMDVHRLLPQDLVAEKGVLSAFVLSPREVARACAQKGIDASHFHHPRYATIFEALMEMDERGIPLDFITLSAEVRKKIGGDGDLGKIGGAGVLTELWTFLATATNAEFYLGTLQEKAIARELIAIGCELAAEAYETEELPELIDRAQQRILALGRRGQGAETLRHVRADCIEAVNRYQARFQQKGQLDGLPTGFNDLDRTLNGLRGPNVYVIGARPAMGKTSLGTEIAAHVSQACGKKVAFFSLEMTREQIIDRLVSSQGRISNESIRRGFFSEADFLGLTAVLEKIAKGGLWLDDSLLTPARYRRQARTAVVERGCELIVVDFVQKFAAGSRGAAENETTLVNQAMTAITETAKELNVPSIVLAQVNRSGEKGRKDHRPTMADLKQSGQIEQDAYAVGLLHRPVYYCKTPEDRAKAAEKLDIAEGDLDTYAELDLTKHRNGGVGIIPMKFLGIFTRFESANDNPLYSNNPERRQLIEGRPAAPAESAPEPEEPRFEQEEFLEQPPEEDYERQ